MHTSKTYKELGIKYFKEVFEIIDNVLVARQIPYYLIGVTAVALQLLEKGIKPSRGTKDIDFALMLGSIKEFETVVSDLEVRGFRKVKAPWTLFHPEYNVAIDLLPFGEIEEDDTINFNERYSDLHMLGFKEVMSDPEMVLIEERLVNVPPLAGMILLKLIAWYDRPEDRQNDLSDVLLIIRKFYDIAFDEIVTEHYDLLDVEGTFDELLISARVLGRKSGHYLLKSEKLKDRISQVIATNMSTADEHGPISIEWARILNQTVEYAQQILDSFMNGMRDGMKNLEIS